MKKLLCLLVCYFLSVSVLAVSFDCKKFNTGIYKIICESPELSKLDDELNLLYERTSELRIKISPTIEPNQVKKRINEFAREMLKERGECLDEKCLIDWYNETIKVYKRLEASYLQAVSTMKDPSTIRRTIEPTDNNITEYCSYMANLSVGAYTEATYLENMLLYLSFIDYSKVLEAKEKLNIDERTYKRLLAGCVDDARVIALMKIDAYRTQKDIHRVIRIKCEAEPTEWMINYYLIFSR